MKNELRDLLQLNQRVFIVAEIGKAFIQTEDDKTVEEYLINAKALILAAKEAGADAVKFQTHHIEDEQLDMPVVSPHFSGTERYAWVRRNMEATPLEFWQEVKAYADKIGITFFTTPMSRGAAQKLETLDIPLWKVGSGDILDFVMLDYLTLTGKPIIISTGMSTMAEIDCAVEFLRERGAEFTILHCISKYPASFNELALGTIPYFKERYKVPIGFSDHSIGAQAAVAAVCSGARIIEKHLSIARDLWGSDHKVSMRPHEFKQMVDIIRRNDAASTIQFDNSIKILDEKESMFRPIFRKSLMAGQDIAAGTIITKEMLYAMRPQQYAGGLPSQEYKLVIGKKSSVGLKKYDPITKEAIIA